MKNLLSILFLFCFSLGAMAQTSVVTMTVAGSPVTDGGTATATATINSSYETVTIQAIFTKTSGTLAGTATLQASLDGTNYFTVATQATTAGAATYTVTNVASQSISFIITKSPFKHYRVSWTGTGTMVGTMAAYILPK